MEREKYYRFSTYLKRTFGCRVYKVSIDAGFSCPNIDGTFSKNGCIFCDNKAFSHYTRVGTISTEEQIEKGIGYGKRRYRAEKFIIYFQAFTNTYASVEVLKQKYDIIRKFDKNIVALAIGTRPDCIDEEKLDLIESYAKDYEVWIEYGLQSIHKKTLKLINRNHTYTDFLQAVKLTRKRNIKICAHVIVGLQGETEREILETAKECGYLKLDGIKIHPLHIVKGTVLEKIFHEGKYKPLELEEYVELSTKFLEYLYPETVIQRLTADCPEEFLVAPGWINKKQVILKKIDEKLEKKERFQGKRFKPVKTLTGKNKKVML